MSASSEGGGGGGGESGSGSGGGNNNNSSTNGPPDALRFEAILTPLDAAGNGSALAAAVLSAKVAIRLSLALRVDGGSGGGREEEEAVFALPAIAFASASSPLPGRALWAEGDLRLEQPGGELGLGLRRRRRRAAAKEEPRLTRYQRRAAEFWRALAGAGVEEEEEKDKEEDQTPFFEEEEEAEGPLPPLFPELSAPSSSSSTLDLLAATGDPSLAASIAATSTPNNNSNRLRASFSPSLATWVAIAPGEPWRPQRTGPSSSSTSTTFRVSLTVRLPKRPLLLVRPTRADAFLWAWARFWAVWMLLGGVAGWLGSWAVRRGGLWAARASDVSAPAWRF